MTELEEFITYLHDLLLMSFHGIGVEKNKMFVDIPFWILYFWAEHMLFYASEKYPSEDSYSKYISEVLTANFTETHHTFWISFCKALDKY